jgi:ATP-dependent Clp protease ATP-binding subunit ClpA
MQQLDDLMSDLAKAKDIEAAAQMDVSDRAVDERLAQSRRAWAESCLESASEQVTKIRRELHRVIEAQTHSMFDDDLEPITND